MTEKSLNKILEIIDAAPTEDARSYLYRVALAMCSADGRKIMDELLQIVQAGKPMRTDVEKILDKYGQ